MKKYIWYGVGIGIVFLLGYILASYNDSRTLDSEHDELMDIILRSSETISNLKKKVSEMEKEISVETVQEDTEDILDDEDKYDEYDGPNPNIDPNRKPYLISFDDFEDPEYDIFDKVPLSYYPLDDVLSNDEYEAVDIDSTVGNDNLNPLRTDIKTNCIYIRNEYLETDYEIVKEEGSYEEEVLGLYRGRPDDE